MTGADFSQEDAPDFIVVSAIVEVAKEAVLFVGVLDDFFFDADGRLDRLVLQGVSRRPISDDKMPRTAESTSDIDRFYKVDGDSFVLRYSESITLNVKYVRLTTKNPSVTLDDTSVR